MTASQVPDTSTELLRDVADSNHVRWLEFYSRCRPMMLSYYLSQNQLPQFPRYFERGEYDGLVEFQGYTMEPLPLHCVVTLREQSKGKRMEKYKLVLDCPDKGVIQFDVRGKSGTIGHLVLTETGLAWKSKGKQKVDIPEIPWAKVPNGVGRLLEA